MAKLILVTGGARSGKSHFAEQLADSLEQPVAYIATAEVWDPEMAERVSMHQQRRPEHWTTFEAPRLAEQAIGRATGQADVILFDCLTVYTSNCLLAQPELLAADLRRAAVLEAIEQLLTAARQFTGTIIFVTNEVGDGIVPDNRLAREFRDLAGLVNQRVAQAASEVYLVVCGLPVEIKSRALFPAGGNQ
jgi:adenosylcobinamide kinase/adenosylcobinamide-phosphate guanylyltransferase